MGGDRQSNNMSVKLNSVSRCDTANNSNDHFLNIANNELDVTDDSNDNTSFRYYKHRRCFLCTYSLVMR